MTSFKSPRTWLAELANAAQFNADVRDQFSALWPYTTKGDLAVATDASNITRLAVGADNTYLAADSTQPGGVKWASAGLVPVGGIILWSGSVATIPAGWTLCDGTVGTPDLRGRFVVGAGGAYSPGATGGSATVDLPAHTHTVNIASISTYDGTNVNQAGVPDYAYQIKPPYWLSQTHYHNVTVPITSGSASGSASSYPPYYALCYIMRIS